MSTIILSSLYFGYLTKISTILFETSISKYQSKFEKILLIDVRENDEFKNGSLKGSISIPLGDIEENSYLELIKKEAKDKEIFTLCKMGKRSEEASKILMKFKIQSTSIEGGIDQINQILTNK